MSVSKQHISDESDGKYFYIMLNMSDDDLDPYEHRLLGHYLRKKSCWETVATTAKITKMSVGKVVKTRNRLQELGYIKIQLSDRDTYLITVIDRMQENVARYESLARSKKAAALASSPGEGQIHEVKNRKFKVLHEVKQRITNLEEQEEEELKNLNTSVSAVADAIFAPVNSASLVDEAMDDAMFPASLAGSRKTKSAQAEKAEKRLTTATTPPIPNSAPPLSPAAKIDSDGLEDSKTITDEEKPVKTKKVSPKVEANRALADALGEAWGIAPVGGDYGLYIKVANRLASDGIGVEDFKGFCDWRKEQAGAFASKITIGSLTGNGHISAYLAHRNVKVEAVRKQKELEEKFYAKHPEARPTEGPIEYMPADEVARYMAIALGTSHKENVS